MTFYVISFSSVVKPPYFWRHCLYYCSKTSIIIQKNKKIKIKDNFRMEKIKSTAMMTVMASFNHSVMTKNERQFKINESLRSKKKNTHSKWSVNSNPFTLKWHRKWLDFNTISGLIRSLKTTPLSFFSFICYFLLVNSSVHILYIFIDLYSIFFFSFFTSSFFIPAGSKAS